MDTRHAYFLGAVLAAPLTIWAGYQSYLKFAYYQEATRLFTALSLLLFAITGAVQQHLIARSRFSSRARALGCGAVSVFPHRDPILGLDYYRGILQAFYENRSPQLHQGRLDHHGGPGRTFAYLQLGSWAYLTDEPENVKTILSTSFESWPIAGQRLDSVMPVLGDKSVLTCNGRHWHDARQMQAQVANRHQTPFQSSPPLCATRWPTGSASIDTSSTSWPRIPHDERTTVDLQELVLRMTMDISTDFLLGAPVNMLTQPTPLADQFVRDFSAASLLGAKRSNFSLWLLPFLPRAELDGAVSRLRAYVRSYLREAKAAIDQGKAPPPKRDYVFLHEPLRADAHEEYVVDQMLSILIAGRDTTAGALSAVFWHLARNPGVVRKLRVEMADLGTQDPTWEQLRDLKYLGKVIREGLRLFPPVPLNSRTANRETILPRGGGPDGKQPILIPKGTLIRCSTYSLQRRKDIYGPDAEEFRPERWDAADLHVMWEYIPFSGGPRICLGQQFALTQLSLTIFRFFQKFQAIEARDEGPMKYQTSLTISIANGCKVVATPA